MNIIRKHAHSATTARCHRCGARTLRSYLISADELRSEVVALLQISEHTGQACTTCVDGAECELDGTEGAIALDGTEEDVDAKLAADPFFAEVCDARNEAYLTHVLDAETAVQWAALARCGGDALDAAVTA